MGTTKTDTTTAQFDPQSMGTFHGLTGALGETLPGFMTNPFGSPQFGLEQQMGTRQAQNLGQTGTSNLMRNMTASGMMGGAGSPAGLEMLQNQGRANTGLQANMGFLAPYMAALQRQQYAMGLGSQYRPLQTGQVQTEKTSGLGTWLPQVAQLGMGLGSMFMGGAPGGFNFGSANNFAPMSQMQPWAGAGAGVGGMEPSFGSGVGLGYGPLPTGTPPPPPFGM